VKGAQPIRRLCDRHRQAFGQGQLQAHLAPGNGSDGSGCQFPVRMRPDPDRWCDICGALDDLVPGVDGPDRPEVVCADEDFCSANRARRYPPDPARAPQWIYQAQARITDEQSRTAILTASAQAVGDYLALVAQEDELELELASQQDDYALRGVPAGSGGAYDTLGNWHPSVLNWAHINWSHTIRGGAHHGHLISGGARGAPVPLPPLPAQAEGGGQDRHEIPPTGIPEGVRQAIDGDHVGGDIQTQAPELPEGAPARPTRTPRDRYGNRRGRKAAFPKRVLKYSGRR
jgi:hypothetical protein